MILLALAVSCSLRQTTPVALVTDGFSGIGDLGAQAGWSKAGGKGGLTLSGDGNVVASGPVGSDVLYARAMPPTEGAYTVSQGVRMRSASDGGGPAACVSNDGLSLVEAYFDVASGKIVLVEIVAGKPTRSAKSSAPFPVSDGARIDLAIDPVSGTATATAGAATCSIASLLAQAGGRVGIYDHHFANLPLPAQFWRLTVTGTEASTPTR